MSLGTDKAKHFLVTHEGSNYNNILKGETIKRFLLSPCKSCISQTVTGKLGKAHSNVREKVRRIR